MPVTLVAIVPRVIQVVLTSTNAASSKSARPQEEGEEDGEDLEMGLSNSRKKARGHVGLTKRQSSMMVIEPDDEAEWLRNDITAFETENDQGSTVTVNIEQVLKSQMCEFEAQGWLLGKPMYCVSQKGSYMQMTVTCENDISSLMMVKLENLGIGTEVGSVGVSEFSGRTSLREKRLRKEREEKRRAMKQSWWKYMYQSAGSGKKEKEEDGGVSSSPAAAKVIPGAKGLHSLSSHKFSMMGKYLVPKHDEKFLKMASAVRVETLSEEILSNMEWDFDYIGAVIIAGIIAGMGLITNSSVTLIASMLVSPIMSPILGFTFGIAVKDYPMCLKGAWMELWSLAICVVIGFVLMLILMADDPKYVTAWVTPEMLSRGEEHNLASGASVAIPSGVGVALSVLSNNVSSLVGVAISASLLPPAVNAGMLWAYWLFADLILDDSWDTDDAYEAGRWGGISLSLTLVNVACIFAAGSLTFLLKRVAPISRTDSFWRQDLRRAGGANEREDLLKDTEEASSAAGIPRRIFQIPNVAQSVSMSLAQTIYHKGAKITEMSNPERWTSEGPYSSHKRPAVRPLSPCH
jgi:uncharacterized hydrophobic protein (TIGR00271 family)